MKKIERLLIQEDHIREELKIPCARISRSMEHGTTWGLCPEQNIVWAKAVEMAKRIIELDEEEV